MFEFLLFFFFFFFFLDSEIYQGFPAPRGLWHEPCANWVGIWRATMFGFEDFGRVLAFVSRYDLLL
jgi:hypothetical protein